MSGKKQSDLITQTKENAETQLRKMCDAYQRFYTYVNNDLINLEEIKNSHVNPNQIENQKILMNKSLVNVRKSIGDLNKYYETQLKPFLDNLDK